ncbi:MAG TPA: CopD family protein [Ilumatobacteraceae bacterium]|nr:CopD family protein [Ilumatobacteraceae bacterium]
MPRTLLRRLVLLALATCALVAVPTGGVFAHNTLLSSDPADGASLDAAPTQITWEFENPVPLETMTVTLIEATGVRSELGGSAHGSAGDTQVVTPLPALTPGEVSLRWRLVGADGHPVTGRVDFTISAAAETADTAAGTAADTAVTAPSNADDATSVESSVADEGDGSFSTPSPMRWVLRYGSYLAIMAVVGILLTSALVWAGAGSLPLLRSILSWSLLVVAVLAFVQVLVIASDISGSAPWSSFGSIDAATTTDAGMAFMIRIVLALAMWIVLFRYRLDHPDVYWSAVSLCGLGLLATWAFAGHSTSMRWPTIGVLTDVAHHGAAAAWIAGLAIVGWIVLPRTTPEVMVPAVRNFSRVAAISVAVLVVTGLLQTWRLVGNPANLFDADHGRYLAVKIVALAGMLLLANANRRRVDGRLDDTSTVASQVGPLRRAIVAEFAIGLVIVAITAAMVVSPPATSETATDATATDATATPASSTAVFYTL